LPDKEIIIQYRSTYKKHINFCMQNINCHIACKAMKFHCLYWNSAFYIPVEFCCLYSSGIIFQWNMNSTQHIYSSGIPLELVYSSDFSSGISYSSGFPVEFQWNSKDFFYGEILPVVQGSPGNWRHWSFFVPTSCPG